jgi:hypothetical protein
VIDKQARAKLSESLRHLVSGQITNVEFENNIPRKSKDRAVNVIRRQAWLLYDGMKEYKLKGKYAVASKDKGEIARWLLFLKTNYEYEWPAHPTETWWGMLLSLLSISLIPRLFWNRKWMNSGNYPIWPYIRKADLTRARRTPRLLSGSRG